MRKTAILLALLTATTAQAQGDIASGEALFGRRCTTCHALRDDDGVAIAGGRARSGPNLYHTAEGPIAAVKGFRYGRSILELNARGDVWTEDSFVAYVADPTGWLRDTLDNPRARGKMAFRLRDEQEARDIYAYLLSLKEE